MIEAPKEFLAQQEELYAKRKAEILNTKDELVIKGTTYYVSNAGDDNADGKSPETAWKTIDRVNKQWLLPGDGVLFNRGDIWRGKAVQTMPGVSYGAYGEGDKPKFYGWIEDMADASLWELVMQTIIYGNIQKKLLTPEHLCLMMAKHIQENLFHHSETWSLYAVMI